MYLKFNKKMTTAKSQKNFAKSFEELEKIAREFEDRQDLDIDDAVKKFERGLELSQELKERLREIEQKVQKIQQKFSANGNS